MEKNQLKIVENIELESVFKTEEEYQKFLQEYRDSIKDALNKWDRARAKSEQESLFRFKW